VERIVQRYREECGVEVHVQYGGSNLLLSQIEVSRRGDLYLAGEVGYVEQGRQKGLIAEVFPVCYVRPVIGVRKGNPKNITSCADLVRDDVRLAVVNPEAGALGKVVRRELAPTSIWDRVHDAVQKRGVYKPNVMEVANDVKLGSADAAFLWDCTVAQMPELEAVTVPEFQDVREQFTLGVLKNSTQPTGALRFARYLTACDRGLEVFQACGYQDVAPGEVWEPAPKVTPPAGEPVPQPAGTP
jgi:molybdenum ABC transporter molybdate-binding protein